GGADAAAVLGADGDVLQVRVVRAQPSGGGAGLVVAGVQAAGVGVHHLRQLVGVGVAQLGQAAVLEDQARQLVLVGDGLQRLFVGGRRAGGRLHQRRQLEFVEQQGAELLGRVEVEGAAGDLVRALLRGQHAPAEV